LNVLKKSSGEEKQMSHYYSKVLAVSILAIVSLTGCGRPRMESMEQWQQTDREGMHPESRTGFQIVEVYNVGKKPDTPYEKIDTIEAFGDTSVSTWEVASVFPWYLRPFLIVGATLDGNSGRANEKLQTETDLIEELIFRARGMGGDAILMTKKSKAKCAAVVIRWKKSENRDHSSRKLLGSTEGY
jgi:hypothetical protein